MTTKSNSTEIAKVADGTVSFDHATGTMKANWNNGRSETWSMGKKGYSRDTAYQAFKDCVERWSN